MARLGPEERFWSHVVKGTECWLWTGAKYPRGYGQFWLEGKKVPAHRAVLILHGVDLADKVVCHHCDIPSCVRPDHLFVGTQSDNIRDMYAKGRDNTPAGATHHHGSKTHCPKGHEFDAVNTVWRKTPWGRGRACRLCKREANRNYMRRISANEPEKRRRWRG